MTTIDLQSLFTSYKSEEVAVLPEGTYELEVVRATVRGDNGILPVFKVRTGPYAGKTAMCGQMTLSDAAKSIFFRNLKGFGIDEAFIKQCQGIKDIANALVGRIVEMKVTIDEWNGEERNKFPIGGVKLVALAGGPEGVPAAPAPVEAVAEAPPAQHAPPPPPPAPPAGGSAAAPF